MKQLWKGGFLNNAFENIIIQDCACIIGDASTCEIGVPHWVGDDFCDDVNNNVMCGFDGGDCCPPHAKPAGIWDWYCNDCECLEPRNSKVYNSTFVPAF